MKINLKKIGKGSFSIVYQLTDKQVLIISKDHIKECMSLNWFPESYLFPKIIRLSECEYSKNHIEGELPCGFQAYVMPYYRSAKSRKVVSQLSPRQHRLYKALRKLFNQTAWNYRTHKFSHGEIWIKQFQTLPSEFAKERTALIEAVDACMNYCPSACFEISPRNIATHNKKLVLLDCFFLQKQLNKKG